METLFPSHWASRDEKKLEGLQQSVTTLGVEGFDIVVVVLFIFSICAFFLYFYAPTTCENINVTQPQTQGQKNSFMKKQFWRCRWFLVFSYSSDCFPFWLLFKRGRHSHADTTNHEYIQKESKRVVLIIYTYKRRLKYEKTHGRMKITFWTFARLSVRVFIFATTSCFQR